MLYSKWSLGLTLCGGAVLSGVFIYWQYRRHRQKKTSYDDYVYVLSDRFEGDDRLSDGPIHHIDPIDESESSFDFERDSADMIQINEEYGNEFSCVGDLYTSNGVMASREPCEDEDDSDQIKKVTRKILILGLDQSGKSSLLARLAKENRDCRQYVPTRGFNVVCVSFESVDLSLWEIGGGMEYRNYWGNFVADVDLVLFACDASSNAERMTEAKMFLHDILEDLDVDVDVHIISTKCDKSDAMTSQSLREKLDVSHTDISVLRVSVKSAGAQSDMGIDDVQSICLDT